MKNLLKIFVAVLIGATCSVGLYGQEAPTISIQGTLKDASGSAVSDGTYTVTFRLFNSEAGGSPLWQEEAPVEVVGGIYTHYLGSVTSLNAANFGNVLYLGLKVGNYELNPRTKLTYAPYTFASATVVCSGAVGDVKYSVLNPTEFAAVNGDCWVPLDGRALAGNSQLRQIKGWSNLPDAGGLFFRAQEFPGSPNNDPGRSSSTTIATVQGDDVKPHNHSMNSAGAHNHNYEYFIASGPVNLDGENYYSNVRYGVGWEQRTTSLAGDHVHQISNNSGDETRPKNLNLWVYIRIN